VVGCAPRPATTPVQVVEITAGDFFFRAPDTVHAGWTEFRLTNAGGRHVMAVARLDSGRTLADVLAVPDTASASPAWMVDLGGPVTGDSNGIAIAALELTPGRYVLYCYFGGDDHIPHYAKGMVKEFLVTGPAVADAAAPEPGIVVTVTDYDFQLSRPLTPGRHTLRFVNTSTQGHEIIMTLLPAGMHQDDWMKARAAKAPRPGRNFGGIGGLPQHRQIDMTADFPAGDYVWYCVFVGADGRSHLDHGMIKEVHVE